MTLDTTAARLEVLLARATNLPGQLRNRYPLPVGYCDDDEHGVSADDPESLIMSFLDSGPHGKRLMQTLAAYDFTVSKNDDLDQAADVIEALLSERRASKEENDRLREALQACARQFRFYEKQHLFKGTEEGKEKARTNAYFAQLAETALAANGGEHD